MTTTLVAPRTAPKVSGMPTSGLMLLVGDTKSGKTWLGASFPGAYVIELEHKRGDRIPHGRIDDLVERYYQLDGELPGREKWLLDTFGDVLVAAIDDPDVKTIVIDSVDELANLIASDIARDAGVEFLGQAKKDVDNFSLWGEYSQRIKGLTDHLKECGKLAIIIAHRRPAKLDKDEHIIKPAGINVSGQGGDYLAKHAEVIGFMDVRVLGGKGQHFLTFKGESARTIWRSGIEELNDKEVVIRKDAPYESLLSLFAKPVVTAAPKLVSKPAPAKATGKKR